MLKKRIEEKHDDSCRAMTEIMDEYPHLAKAAKEARKEPEPLDANHEDAPFGYKPSTQT